MIIRTVGYFKNKSKLIVKQVDRVKSGIKN